MNKQAQPDIVPSEQGRIINLNTDGFVGLIESKAGSRRSSHRHREDAHHLYVVSGEMHYWHRPEGSEVPPTMEVYGPGQMVYTGPAEDHWTYFPVDTVLVSVSKLHRTKENHEGDLTRVPWVPSV